MKKTVLTILTPLTILTAEGAVSANVQAIMQAVTSNVVRRLSEKATRTNHVLAIASKENYALLKSTKLKDAAAKLALQKRIADAVLEDADNDEKCRLKWHGAYASQRIDWANERATFVHEDGHEVSVAFKVPNIREEVTAANAKLPKPVETNGVPAKLAAARLRWRREQAETNVTVNVEAKGKGPRP